jgi:hypothetical protein
MAPHGQRPEQRLEPVRLGQIVVMLQHRQQQTLAEAARAQKDQLIARRFDVGDAIGTVQIPVVLFDEFAEVAQTIGKLHACILRRR